MPPHSKNVLVGSRLLCGGWFCLLLFAVGCKGEKSNESSWDESAQEFIPIGIALETAEAFRQHAGENIAEAMEKFCSLGGRSDLNLAMKVISATSERPNDLENEQRLWGSFFQSSILGITGLDPYTQLIVYYQPWDDAFLFTEWRRLPGENPKVHHAKLVNGDVVRHPSDISRIEPLPKWLRMQKVPPQLAVLLSTRESLTSFLKLYQDAFQSKQPRNWQSRLQILESSKGRETNDDTLIVHFGLVQTQTLSFLYGEASKPLRENFLELISQLEKGDFDKVKQGLPQAASEVAVHMASRGQWWETANLVAVAPGAGGRAFIFLASNRTPTEFLCLCYRNKGGDFMLEDIQLQSFNIDEETLQPVRSTLKKEGLTE